MTEIKEKNRKAFTEAVSDCFVPDQKLTGNNILTLIIVSEQAIASTEEEKIDKIDLNEAGKIIGQISQQKVGGEMWERLAEMFSEGRKEFNKKRKKRREWERKWRDDAAIEEERIKEIEEITSEMKEKKELGDEEAYAHFKMKLWKKVLREVAEGNIQSKRLADDAIRATGENFYD